VTAKSSAHFDRKLAYFFFRLSLGINLLIHGLGRFLGPGGHILFEDDDRIRRRSSNRGLVHAFLAVLAFAEFILGSLITSSLFTRWALTLGAY
jgi:uncharacterized membrane protein YphA (DoxX/SURF4 family)